MIVDEGDFVPNEVFLSALLPILRKKPNALICISTDNKKDTFMQSVRNMRADVGKMIRFGSVCPSCARANGGVTSANTDKPCNHAHGYMPPTMDPIREGKLKNAYESAGGTEQYQKEILAQRSFSHCNIFSPEHITRVFDQSYKRRELYNPHYISVGVDPAQGGGCDHAIIATAKDRLDQNAWVRLVPPFFYFIFLLQIIKSKREQVPTNQNGIA